MSMKSWNRIEWDWGGSTARELACAAEEEVQDTQRIGTSGTSRFQRGLGGRSKVEQIRHFISFQDADRDTSGLCAGNLLLDRGVGLPDNERLVGALMQEPVTLDHPPGEGEQFAGLRLCAGDCLRRCSPVRVHALALVAAVVNHLPAAKCGQRCGGSGWEVCDKQGRSATCA